MKKVLVIHTGGTLGMEGKVLEPGSYAATLIGQLPEFKGYAEVDSTILCNLDSSDIGPKQWHDLALLIAEERLNYDGFIVIHGTDTMPYTASALAFALEGLDRPVVLTGAQRPLGALRSDARRNLADALEIATLDIPEVGICFDGVFLRGCRSTKINTRAYHAFDSPGCEALAKLGVDIALASHIRRPQRPFRCLPDFDTGVLPLHVSPGMSDEILRTLFEAVGHALRGILLIPFGVGTIPILNCRLGDYIQEAIRQGVTVFVANPSTGKIDLELYENSRILSEAGAISAREMRTEAALVKLMHAVANFDKDGDRREYLKWNVAGETD